MPEERTIACSLNAGDLRLRLAEIAAVGAESLISHSREGERHLLRFRSDAEARQRLEQIVAAESQCCGFLDIRLEEQGAELVLLLAGPNGGQAVADELALAFVGPRHE
jgi:hypothetical protein